MEKRMRPVRANREAVELFDRLETVELMLGNEPMVEAPVNFADKLMAAIAAGRKPSADHSYFQSQRLALGLAILAVFLAPLLVGTIIVAEHVVSDPMIVKVLFQQILQQLILLLSAVSGAVAYVLDSIAQYVTSASVEPTLLMLVFPTMAVWMWTMIYTAQRRQRVVYRIPVQVM